jgi:hypothetical protein
MVRAITDLTERKADIHRRDVTSPRGMPPPPAPADPPGDWFWAKPQKDAQQGGKTMAQNIMLHPVEAEELITVEGGGLANKIGGVVGGFVGGAIGGSAGAAAGTAIGIEYGDEIADAVGDAAEAARAGLSCPSGTRDQLGRRPKEGEQWLRA